MNGVKGKTRKLIKTICVGKKKPKETIENIVEYIREVVSYYA